MCVSLKQRRSPQRHKKQETTTVLLHFSDLMSTTETLPPPVFPPLKCAHLLRVPPPNQTCFPLAGHAPQESGQTLLWVLFANQLFSPFFVTSAFLSVDTILPHKIAYHSPVSTTTITDRNWTKATQKCIQKKLSVNIGIVFYSIYFDIYSLLVVNPSLRGEGMHLRLLFRETHLPEWLSPCEHETPGGTTN